MILSYSNTADKPQGADMSGWLAKLQEGKKTLTQMQTEMIQSSVDTIKEIQDANLEAAEKTDETDEDAEKKSSDEIKTPSEVTSADLKSPIDIKL